VRNKKAIILLIGIILSIASNINAGNCTVDATTTYQYIHCIGASSAWSSVGTWGQVLFADDNINGHIGLSSLRTRIDPTADVNGTGVWNSELNNITAAYAANPSVLFWSTEWSPPAEYKSNGSVDGYIVNQGVTVVGNFTGSDTGSGANSADTGYASYLTQYVQYCKSYTGVDLYSVSPQNEPSFVVDYEGASWTSGQFDIFVPVLYSDLQNAGLSTKIMIPEPPNEYGMGLASTTMDDANAAPMVGIICTHLYGTFYDTLSQFNFTHVTNQEFWATEISGETVASISADMTGGLAVAGWAHSSLVEGQMNAFHYWWLNDLIYNNAPSSACYALGNFSKFIRPGYYRMAATEVPSTGLQVSAYKNTNSTSPTAFVIVAINNNTSAVDQTFNLNSLNATSVTPWLTDVGNGLVAQAAVPVSGNSFTYQLPASSVVSFVGGVTCTSTAITPYIQVNGGAWQQTNSASVTSTASAVNLGPQPTTGGSWSWTGPNGFTSTAREIDNIPLGQGSNVFTADYTNTSGCISAETFTICAPTYITPYVQVNGGAWQQGVNSVTVTSTASTVNLGPQPLTGGSWSWTGPNGFTSTAREIDNIPLSAGTNTFTAAYTNTCGAASTEIFTVLVQAPTFTETFTMTSSPTFTPTVSPTYTDTVSQTYTYTATMTASPTPTAARTNTATNTPTNTDTVTITESPLPSATATHSDTATPTFTPTNTPSFTVTLTFTWTATFTATDTPVVSITPTYTATIFTTTVTPTYTISPSATLTSTVTPTLTATMTNTLTWTPTPSPTFTGTFTGTYTATLTRTSTALNTATLTITGTNTMLPTVTRTITCTYTPTPALTSTLVNTATLTVTATNMIPSPTTAPVFPKKPKLYPDPINPNRDRYLKISYAVDAGTDSITIKIYTAAFRLVMEYTFDENDMPGIMEQGIECPAGRLKNFSSGTYYYLITAKSGGKTTGTAADKFIILK